MKKGWINNVDDLFGKSCGVKPVIASGGVAGSIRNAKAKIAALKAKCGHNVATAVKLTADPDVVSGIRMLAHGTRVIYTYFMYMSKTLKGPKACAAISQDWASWGWLSALKGTLRQRDDLNELRRCGFTVAFPTSLVSSLETSSPKVMHQDSMGGTLNAYTMGICIQISGYMCWWSCYWPGKFVQLASDDVAVVRQCMHDFREDCEAYWAAKALALACCKIHGYVRALVITGNMGCVCDIILLLCP
jgi:hypothetical protein